MRFEKECPICGSILPKPEKEIIEKIHPWVIIPGYKWENCVRRFEALISKCPVNDCPFLYMKILKEVK